MTIVYKSNSITITKNKKNDFVLSYEDDNYKHFWSNTISQLESYKQSQTKTQKQAFFNAYSIEPLTELLKIKKNLLSYRHAMLLFLCIGDQLNYLEKDKHSVLTFDLKDIIIINSNADRNDSIFLFLNTKKFYPIKDKQIVINNPFNIKNLFLSPELKNINSLPAHIPLSSSYYSIAFLISFCLNNSIIKSNHTFKEFLDHLTIIRDTKLYFSLIRCLDDKPQNRFYLFI
tara:strand:+ start:6731 stop:7420 length:690 start_codon:yes stop_codon:yes gene_type:complete